MAKAPATTQDAPTRPRPIDGNGFERDEWGLPLVGPARIEALDGRADPITDPSGWKRVDEAPADPAPAAPAASPEA